MLFLRPHGRLETNAGPFPSLLDQWALWNFKDPIGACPCWGQVWSVLRAAGPARHSPDGGRQQDGERRCSAVTRAWAQDPWKSPPLGDASVLMSERGMLLCRGVHVLSITYFCIFVCPFSSVLPFPPLPCLIVKIQLTFQVPTQLFLHSGRLPQASERSNFSHLNSLIF